MMTTSDEHQDETIGDADRGPSSASEGAADSGAESLGRSVADRLVARVTELIAPVVDAAGLALDRIEFHEHGHRGQLQVFIDKAGGVSVGDCADMSHQIEVVLDAHDPFPGAWTLEVSSPGLTRPLNGAADFERFAGRLAAITFRGAVDGRSKVVGRLGAVDGECVRVVEEETGAELTLPLDQVAKARLEVEMPGAAKADRGERGGRSGRGGRAKREVGER